MNLKKTGLVVLLSVILLSSAFAAGYRRPVRHSSAIFDKGDMLLTPEVMVISHTTPLGAHLEFAYTRNIGLGGDVLFFFDGSGGIIISPDFSYHFDVKVDNLDLFVGGGPSLAIGFSGGSSFGFKPFAGIRFYFSPKIAAYFKMLGVIQSESSLGAAFGATFKL